MWQNEQKSLLMDIMGRLQPAIDLMSPTPASSQPHHNDHLSNIISLKSNNQLRIQQHFFTKFLPPGALGFVLNL